MDSEQRDGWDQESERAWKNDSKDLEFPEDVVKLLKSLVPLPARILDSGCGIGKHLRAFVKLGYTAVGVEQSKVGAGYAQQLNPQVEIFNVRLQEMAFKNEFDMIFTSAVLQHSLNERKPLIYRRFHDALKSGGIYFCTENTLRKENVAVHFKADSHEPITLSDDATDGYSFTEKGWIKLLATNGFQHVQTIFPWPFYFYRKVET